MEEVKKTIGDVTSEAGQNNERVTNNEDEPGIGISKEHEKEQKDESNAVGDAVSNAADNAVDNTAGNAVDNTVGNAVDNVERKNESDVVIMDIKGAENNMINSVVSMEAGKSGEGAAVADASVDVANTVESNATNAITANAAASVDNAVAANADNAVAANADNAVADDKDAKNSGGVGAADDAAVSAGSVTITDGDVDDDDDAQKTDGDINFAKEMESSLVTLRTGQTVKGRIIRSNSSEVYVDLGYKSDGVIPLEDFMSEEGNEPGKSVKINDVVEVFVVRVNDSEGTVLLSKKRVDEKNNWLKIESAYENGEPINAIIIEITNGGLVALSSGVKVFIPASHVSDRYVEDLRDYLKKTVRIKLIDYNKQKKKFVGSIKVLLVEEKKKKLADLWNNITVGKEYEGTVKSITSFGAFVDIGGVDGLVHVSELSWGRIKHPSDVLKVGETVLVRVSEFDREKKKISLGYRREEDNPWYKIDEKYPIGSVVAKKVVRLAPFGAFIEMEKGVDALVHVSQISDTRISKPDDVLTVGMEVNAKVMEINLETKKISLSIKEVAPIPYHREVEEIEVKPVREKAARAASADSDDDGYRIPKENSEALSTSLGDAFNAEILAQTLASQKLVAEAEAEAEAAAAAAAAAAKTAADVAAATGDVDSAAADGEAAADAGSEEAAAEGAAADVGTTGAEAADAANAGAEGATEGVAADVETAGSEAANVEAANVETADVEAAAEASDVEAAAVTEASTEAAPDAGAEVSEPADVEAETKADEVEAVGTEEATPVETAEAAEVVEGVAADAAEGATADVGTAGAEATDVEAAAEGLETADVEAETKTDTEAAAGTEEAASVETAEAAEAETTEADAAESTEAES